MTVIAGIDEVGRGCLAGAVMAVAVILDPQKKIAGLKDSKKLTPTARESLSLKIKNSALAWSIGRAEPSEIDRMNILEASLLAMRRAYGGLAVKTGWVKVDGNRYPDLPCPGESIINGDSMVDEISAASILAKVERDAEMSLLDDLYPGYDFRIHKGYPTPRHKLRLRELGPTPLHRRSFAPVAELLFSI